MRRVVVANCPTTLFAQSQRALCTKYAAPLVGPSGSKSGRHEHILFHTRSSSQYNINYNEHVSQVAPINPAISSREAAQPRPGNNIRHGGTSIHGTQAQLQVLPRGRQKTSSSHKNASPHATVYPLAFRSKSQATQTNDKFSSKLAISSRNSAYGERDAPFASDKSDEERVHQSFATSNPTQHSSVSSEHKAATTSSTSQKPLRSAEIATASINSIRRPPTRHIDQKPARKVASKSSRNRPTLYLPHMTSVTNLARLFGVRQEVLQFKMRQSGMANISEYDHVLSAEDASLLALEFGFNPVFDYVAGFDIHPDPLPSDTNNLKERPPIVTIMGHVDHGKTTLLDTLRRSSVAKGEVGGITQHIGAFSVPLTATSSRKQGVEKSITFLDTPGHAAFAAMRRRGARLTDIIVLVVAADDGVMPQTKEVIELIKQEQDTGVVVAVNKVDKEGVDVDSVHQQLFRHGIEVEALGGDVPCVEVSGMSGQGLESLVETISVVAELMELRVGHTGKAQGMIVESKLLKGLGPVATIILQRGTLRPNDHIISGITQARIRSMTDCNGQKVRVALPGMAITISGWKKLPSAGDEVLQASEADIKRAIGNRIKLMEMRSLMRDAEAINEQKQTIREKRELERNQAVDRNGLLLTPPVQTEAVPAVKELRLVIRADVSGSLEAVAGALEGIGNHQVKVKIVHTAVGDICESDVTLAKAIDGAVIAFSVKASREVASIAAREGVTIITADIIYRLMDTVREQVVALLPPILETKVIGEANVLQLYDINVKGKQNKVIAGCRGRNGTISRNRAIRVVRSGKTVYEGNIETLKHLKSDILEVTREMDFGIALQDFEGFQPNDVLQSIQLIKHPGKL